MIIKNLEIPEKAITYLVDRYVDLKDEVKTLRKQLQDMKELTLNYQKAIKKQSMRESFYQSEIMRTQGKLEQVIREMKLAPYLDSKEYKEIK